MSDNEQQIYTLPNNGNGWETGDVITADKMNAIGNVLHNTSAEVANAVNENIDSNGPNNDILARKLDGMVKYFSQTPTSSDLEYNRMYVQPMPENQEEIIVPKQSQYLQFKANFVSPFSKSQNYAVGAYVEYNDSVYKVLTAISANASAADDAAAWSAIIGTSGKVREINVMQELDNLINVYSSDSQLTQAQNRIWIQQNSTGVQVPTYDEFSELKSACDSVNQLIGNVSYVGDPTTMTPSQATRISINIVKNRITLNNTSATTESPRYYRINNGISNILTTSNYNTDTLHLQLKNGHRYRFLVKAISGTVTHESDKSLLLYLKHTGMSALAESFASVELTTLTDEEYHDFTAGNELFNIYIRQYDGITCTNAVFDVYLIDLTAADKLTVDATPVSDSANLVTSGGVYTALAGKQDTLSYDPEPTENSTNPVTSGGIYTALTEKQNTPICEVKYYSDTPSTKELTNITWTQNKNRITINGSNGTINQIGKISGEFTASNVTNGNISSYLNNMERDILLKAGHVYQISTKYISGSFTKASEDNSFLYVRIRNEDGYFMTVGINNDKKEFVISTDTMVAIYVHGYVGYNVYDHLAFDVFLEDITSLRGYPTYFNANDYMLTKLDAISANARTIGANQDAFWFITDYHFRDNEGHSIPMLKFLSKQTGINKLLFGGDAGGTLGTSQSAIDERLRLSAQAWADMASTVDEFYGTLGNHEWLQTGSVGPGGVMNSYLNRYKQIAKAMDPITGSYRIDNIANKIRYYFIHQAELASYPATASVAWMAEDLKTIGDGWSVVVVTHYGYIPSDVTYAECGVNLNYSNNNNKAISKILCAMRDHQPITFNNVTYDYTTLDDLSDQNNPVYTHQHVIGVFGGHRHHGFLYTESEVSGIENIAVFLGSTDSMNAGSVSENGHNWYWQDGVVGGTKVERIVGTTDEQCFYAVQIDLDNKKLYITAVGGDHNYEGYYEPSGT